MKRAAPATLFTGIIAIPKARRPTADFAKTFLGSRRGCDAPSPISSPKQRGCRTQPASRVGLGSVILLHGVEVIARVAITVARLLALIDQGEDDAGQEGFGAREHADRRLDRLTRCL